MINTVFVRHAVCILAISSLSVSSSSSQICTAKEKPKLSEEGELRRAAHEFLFDEFSKDRELSIAGEGDARVLNEISVMSERVEVDGEMLLTLPEGAQRVAGMFRYLVLKGENLDQLEGLTLLPFAPATEMARSTKTPNLYRVQIAALPVPTADMPRMQIKSRGKATITEVAFNSQGRLSFQFDDIPYRNLGSEFPREKVSVTIDLDRELSISGHVDLEREKWFRYYAAPGTVPESFERWAAERNFSPGRQMFKFEPALVQGYSPKQPKLAEDASRPGHADLSFFDQYDSGSSVRQVIPEFRDAMYAMCFNDWPHFMSVKGAGRGTPLAENFDAAAELAAAYVKDQIEDGGRTATYWEVKNESTIKSEWDYHYQKEHDSWKLLADFHNKTADAIHKVSPETKVCGPTSAWMQVQVNNFDLYRRQTKFMDDTRGHLDVYSHHFYEDIGSLGAWERSDTKYTNYLLGRLEAILNMFSAHMHGTDNVRPIIITECGSLQPGRGPSDYWLRLRSWNAYETKIMQRPHEIDLLVPFAFLTIPWNPNSGNVAFMPKAGNHPADQIESFEPTPVKYFFELWRDFDGRRLPVTFERQNLDIVVLHKGENVRLAITNMSGRQISVDLSGTRGDLPVKSVFQRRLHYQDGRVKFNDAIEHKDAGAIPVDVEETTIVTLTLNAPLQISSQIRREFAYAGETAVAESKISEQKFNIKLKQVDSVENATMVVGIHIDGGLQQPLEGTINGQPFKQELSWAKDVNNLFAPIRIPIPAITLAELNAIKINPITNLTITSVHLETDCVSRK